jgi:hypothetical protein
MPVLIDVGVADGVTVGSGVGRTAVGVVEGVTIGDGVSSRSAGSARSDSVVFVSVPATFSDRSRLWNVVKISSKSFSGIASREQLLRRRRAKILAASKVRSRLLLITGEHR